MTMPEPPPETVTPTPPTPEEEAYIRLKTSAKLMEELRNGRDLTNIPLNDGYWEAQKNHQERYVEWCSAKGTNP